MYLFVGASEKNVVAMLRQQILQMQHDAHFKMKEGRIHVWVKMTIANKRKIRNSLETINFETKHNTRNRKQTGNSRNRNKHTNNSQDCATLQ